MAWFRHRNSSLFGISVSNFMCMSFVGRSLTIVSYVAFKMAALWFWTMFNCNPPIAHCHPLLWGGGILVDHWSTISSYTHHTTKLLGGIRGGGIGFTPSVRPASRVRSVAPTVLVGSISYLYICQATSEGVSACKFVAKFQTLNFWQYF